MLAGTARYFSAGPCNQVQHRHHDAGGKLERPDLRAPAEQQAGLQDVEGAKPNRAHRLLGFALDPQIEVAGGGARRRPRKRARSAARPPRALRARTRGVTSKSTRRKPRGSRRPQRRAERTEGHLRARALERFLQRLEAHDAVGQSRQVRLKWPARHGDHAAEIGLRRELLEQVAPTRPLPPATRAVILGASAAGMVCVPSLQLIVDAIPH